MADAEWRLQRISRLQASYITSGVENKRDIHRDIYSDKPEPGQERLVGNVMQSSAADVDRFARYEVQLQRIFMNAYKQLMAFRDRLQNDRQLAIAQAELDRDPSEPPRFRHSQPLTSPYYHDDHPPDQTQAPSQTQTQSRITPKEPTTSDPPGSADSDESAA